MIETIDLTKTYQVAQQEVPALKGINIRVDQGEMLAIMGPSGSGKSTFMTLLGCLDTPTSGQMLIEGVDISQYEEKELAHIRNQKIGFVFQSFNLLNDMSALDNVALPLFYARMPKAERLEKAAAALEKVGLAERMHHTPLELSGGQQQRVSIARALVNDPALLLADEPTGALDTKNSHEIMELLMALNAKGTTLVIITHEPEIAHCTKRILWLRDGEIMTDTPNEPQSAYAPEDESDSEPSESSESEN